MMSKGAHVWALEGVSKLMEDSTWNYIRLS